MDCSLTMSKRHCLYFFFLLMLGQGVHAHCLVVGSPDARVQAAEGLLTPVATSRQCEALRLLSGSARAMWTAHDGQPGVAPIRADAPPQGYPGATRTSPQDRLRQVMVALHSEGTSARAGYKRFDAASESFDVYPDLAGVAMPWRGPGKLELMLSQGRTGRLLGVLSVAAGQRVILPAEVLIGNEQVRVQWRPDAQVVESLLLRRLPKEEMALAAQAVQGLAKLEALPPADRATARAMVFESLGLSFQRDMALMP